MTGRINDQTFYQARECLYIQKTVERAYITKKGIRYKDKGTS